MPLLTDLQTMMPHLMRTVDRIQAGERFVLSYDDAPTEGGPLTPAGRHGDGERADAPSSEETSRRPNEEASHATLTSGAKDGARTTKTHSTKRASARARPDPSHNGSEAIPVMRAPTTATS